MLEKKRLKELKKIWKALSEIPEEYDLYISEIKNSNDLFFYLACYLTHVGIKTKHYNHQGHYEDITCAKTYTCKFDEKGCLLNKIFVKCTNSKSPYQVSQNWIKKPSVKQIKKDAAKIYEKLKEYG